MNAQSATRPASDHVDAVDDGACTRARILDAALGLFAEKGYGATSMREIGEQLSITKAALYYHFDSKEDIVRALLESQEAKVAELTEWACSQPPTGELRQEVLDRWSDIMQERGLTLFRFLLANRAVVHGLKHERDGMFELMHKLLDHLVPSDATVEQQLRMRLALMSVNVAGMIGADIDAPEADILDAARTVARQILPPD